MDPGGAAREGKLFHLRFIAGNQIGFYCFGRDDVGRVSHTDYSRVILGVACLFIIVFFMVLILFFVVSFFT